MWLKSRWKWKVLWILLTMKPLSLQFQRSGSCVPLWLIFNSETKNSLDIWSQRPAQSKGCPSTDNTSQKNTVRTHPWPVWKQTYEIRSVKWIVEKCCSSSSVWFNFRKRLHRRHGTGWFPQGVRVECQCHWRQSRGKTVLKKKKNFLPLLQHR